MIPIRTAGNDFWGWAYSDFEAELFSRIKLHEGLALESYEDVAGYWTIGWGHKLGRDPRFQGVLIGLHQAEELLRQDVFKAADRFMNWKRDYCPGLNAARCGVLIELIFWIGFAGFLRFERMILAIEDKDFRLAALELYHSELGERYSNRAREMAVILWEGKLSAGRGDRNAEFGTRIAEA